MSALDEITEKWKQQRLVLRLMILLVAVVIGGGIWLFALNSGLRSDRRQERQAREESEKREQRAQHSFDSLMLSVAARDKEDSLREIRDSLFQVKISDLNKTIITLSENRSTISTLPVNEFLELVTGYIDSAAAK